MLAGASRGTLSEQEFLVQGDLIYERGRIMFNSGRYHTPQCSRGLGSILQARRV